MRPLHLAVIGCGFIGQRHLEAAARLDGVTVVAVVDRQERLARETAQAFGVPTSHTDPQAVFQDPDVDAVVLAIPTAGRAQLALRAFQAGKHVLLEKPPAMNAAEIRELLAVQGGRVGACCSSRCRLTPVARVATEFLKTGALGALRLVRCRAVDAAGPAPATAPPAWRVSRALNGGGILANWGSYDLDFLLGVTGWVLRPERVFAQTWRIADPLAGHVAPGSDAESHGIALIKCANGIGLSFERGEFTAGATEDTWQIIGADGALRLPLMATAADAAVIHDHWSATQGVISETLWRSQGEPPFESDPLTDFVAAILEKRPPLTGLEQALVIQTILDGIYESARTGRAVELGGGAT